MTEETTPPGEAQDDVIQLPEETGTDPAPETSQEAEGQETEDTGQTEAEGEDGEDPKGEEADEPKPKPKKSAQERIDEITAKRREAERLKQQSDAEVQRLQERLKQYEKPAPRQEDFDSYEDFQAALSAHHYGQLSKQEKEADVKDAQERSKQAQQEAAQALQESFMERAREFAGTVPDYEQKVSDPTLPISDVVGEQIMASEQGPEVAYYLASNRAEAARLSRLTNPSEVAREIGRIEGRLTQPPPKKVTQAPDPVKAIVTGSGSQSTFDAAKADIDQMEAQLRKAGVIS